MSQNIISTQALNYLLKKRASLELKSHWNNINMASSIHMPHSLFCFVFIENEDIALSSDIWNELRHNTYFCLHKTIIITQLQDIFCSGENMSSSTVIGIVMLFFLANCILKVDIYISPVPVIQTKRNSRFSTILFTLALGKFLKHLLGLMMI